MEQNTLNRNKWNVAGTAGLALGAVSSAYLFVGQLIAGDLTTQATLGQQVLALVLWGIKFSLCIFILRFAMTRFAQENPDAGKKQVFKMGVLTALLSALVFSGFYLANMLYISPEFYNKVFGTMISEMSVGLDSNSMETLEKLTPMLPQITFLSNLTYCFLFGTVLSAILSRRINEQE